MNLKRGDHSEGKSGVQVGRSEVHQQRLCEDAAYESGQRRKRETRAALVGLEVGGLGNAPHLKSGRERKSQHDFCIYARIGTVLSIVDND